MAKMRNILLSTSTAILLSACGGGGGGGGSESSTPTPTPTATTATDYSTYQWATNSNINASYKTTYSIDSNAHINVETAWATTKGKYTVGANINQAVKVAVIDEDFEVTHPDIKDKIISTYNASDTSTTNIADVDGDTFYHGLAVAGFIASTYLGVAPEVELILININLDSSIPDSDIIRAFDHAQAQGAKVINCSWGGSAVSNTIQNKISDLKTAGITVVFASGNGNSSGVALNLDSAGNEDPAELTTVLGVGATSVLNDVTTYSNYGSTIDVLAPGGGGKNGGNNLLGILGLDATGNSGENNATDTISGNSLVNNNYTFTSGTSFSAPVTSGVIALMLGVNPNLTPDDIRRILTTTTEKVGTGNGADYSVGNFDTTRAYGKIHATNAVNQASSEF
ncbi:S8 family peptidase [Poseidonibacter lekithochrous]|uniref:S8 family peptidase n=1 Tax=Poseidonibacter lekithochrous TaxID=1904463 RepID=UPI0013D929E0|nr:S8 family serine peptidase [Poseidonibacter lekithochrous]